MWASAHTGPASPALIGMIDVGVFVEFQIDFAEYVIAARLDTFPAGVAGMEIQADIGCLRMVVARHNSLLQMIAVLQPVRISRESGADYSAGGWYLNSGCCLTAAQNASIFSRGHVWA